MAALSDAQLDQIVDAVLSALAQTPEWKWVKGDMTKRSSTPGGNDRRAPAGSAGGRDINKDRGNVEENVRGGQRGSVAAYSRARRREIEVANRAERIALARGLDYSSAKVLAEIEYDRMLQNLDA